MDVTKAGPASCLSSEFDAALQSDLDDLRKAGLFRSLRPIASAQGPVIRIDGRECLNASSNDYLGLANHPRLKQAAIAAIEKYGVGSGASRLVCGNLEPYDDLERALAAFKRKEAAIVFSSGYAANVGAITALVGEGDTVIIDKLCHASIIDGCRQSGATLRVYPHKNLGRLEELLRPSARSPVSTHPSRTLLITETVFSMDGDLAPLREIVELKDRYGAWLMIDEAHATGVFGEQGRGAAEHFGVEDRVEITLGTFSKALGCLGGYVAGSQTLIDHLRNKARSLIYSTALPPSSCAVAAAAVELVAGDEGRALRETLWRNQKALRKGLDVDSPSAILPLLIGDEKEAVEASRRLFERGIFVPAIRYPTVARGKARLRITVSAAHTPAQINTLIAALKACKTA